MDTSESYCKMFSIFIVYIFFTGWCWQFLSSLSNAPALRQKRDVLVVPACSRLSRLQAPLGQTSSSPSEPAQCTVWRRIYNIALYPAQPRSAGREIVKCGDSTSKCAQHKVCRKYFSFCIDIIGGLQNSLKIQWSYYLSIHFLAGKQTSTCLYRTCAALAWFPGTLD